MPRLAIVDDSGGVTGVGSFVQSLLPALLRAPESRRWRLTLVTPRLDLEGTEVELRSAASDDRLGVEWIPARGAEIAGWLESWLRAGHADVAHFVAPDRLPALASPIPLVATFHDFNFRRFETLPLSLRRQLWREIPRWLRACTVPVVSSAFIASEVASYYPGLAPGLRVVRLGIPGLGPPPSRGQWPAFARRAGLPHRFLLTVGWIAPHKNQAAAVEAIAALRRRSLAVALVCAGPNSHQLGRHAPSDRYVRELVDLARSLGLEVGRDLLGLGLVSPQELRMLYRRAVAVVVPSLYEAGSFPLREALREGCPVLCSDAPPLAEDVQVSGGHVWWFPADDAEQLTEQMLEILKNPLEARRWAAETRRPVSSAFDWRRTAKGYLAAYQAALAMGPRPQVQGA